MWRINIKQEIPMEIRTINWYIVFWILICFGTPKKTLAQETPIVDTEECTSADYFEVMVSIKGDGQLLFIQKFEVDIHLIKEGSYNVNCEVWAVNGILSNTCLNVSKKSEWSDGIVMSVDLNQTINFLNTESYNYSYRRPYYSEYFKENHLKVGTNPFCLSYIDDEARKGNVLVGGSGVSAGGRLYIEKSNQGICLGEVDSPLADVNTYEGPEEVFKSFFKKYGYDFQEISYEINFFQP